LPSELVVMQMPEFVAKILHDTDSIGGDDVALYTHLVDFARKET